MDVIRIERVDDVNLKVRCDPGLAQEISDYFTFFVPGYKFMPKYRNKLWDGKIRLFNAYTALLYVGLLPRLAKFCHDREYTLELPDGFKDTPFDSDAAITFIQKLNPSLPPRDYQVDAFIHAVKKRRALLLSPTASGKSFIIYLLIRYFSVKTLVVVPTTSLVNQMFGDFEDYGFDSEKYVHRIYSGHDKNTDKPIVVSTWQSIYQLPKQWFESFRLVIGDEAHTFKAKSLTTLMTKLTDCPNKIGLTGTLDGTETNKLVLEGLFGQTYEVVTTKALMDSGAVSRVKIDALLLEYPDEVKRLYHKSKPDYAQEIDFIVSNQARLKFIKNLALKLEGNTFIMYRFVEKHGQVLYDLIRASTNRPVYFVSGDVSTDEREIIRKILETQHDAIVVCSVGTFSTGVNVKNLHNIIFAHPSKARIKVLQSIGRGLRLHDSKDFLKLYDIADDLSYKSKENHSLRHFIERIKIYAEQQFSYRIHKIRLKT
jgi:superfamily II DNA or RNA helicase